MYQFSYNSDSLEIFYLKKSHEPINIQVRSFKYAIFQIFFKQNSLPARNVK